MLEAFLEAHNEEIARLETKFSSYITSIGRNEIRIWLKQFGEHVDTGLKLLQSLDFYAPRRIIRDFRTAHKQFLEIINTSSLDGVTFFPFGRAGKSGSSLIYHYKTANTLSVARCRYHFSEITSLFGEEELEEHKLVFVDDFIGTGNQAIETWDSLRQIPFPRESQSFLLTLVAFDTAIQRVEENTALRVITPRILSEEDRVFSPTNTTFSDAEKSILREHCENVGHWPTGYGDCQTLIVFHYRIPNNAISILRSETSDWKPLFPRRIS